MGAVAVALQDKSGCRKNLVFRRPLKRASNATTIKVEYPPQDHSLFAKILWCVLRLTDPPGNKTGARPPTGCGRCPEKRLAATERGTPCGYTQERPGIADAFHLTTSYPGVANKIRLVLRIATASSKASGTAITLLRLGAVRDLMEVQFYCPILGDPNPCLSFVFSFLIPKYLVVESIDKNHFRKPFGYGNPKPNHQGHSGWLGLVVFYLGTSAPRKRDAVSAPPHLLRDLTNGL